MAGFLTEFGCVFIRTAIRATIVCLLLVGVLAGMMAVLLWPYVVVPVLATGRIVLPHDYGGGVGTVVLATTLGWWFVVGCGYHALTSMIEDERRLSGEPDTKVLKRLVWGESDD